MIKNYLQSMFTRRINESESIIKMINNMYLLKYKGE